MTGTIRNTDELEFAVFCIENLAELLGIDGKKIYKLLTEDSNILYDYIVPNYEVLHSQDKGYILEDLLDVMRERGIRI